MRVTMYKSTDGKLHETQEAFAKHQSALNMLPKLEALVNKEFGDSTAVDVDFIPQFISTNAEALVEILTESYVPQRGRKASSVATVDA